MKRISSYIPVFIFICVIIVLPRKAYPQQGLYLQPFFMYQYANLANNKDHYNPNFDYISTYKPAFGLRTIYNFTNAVGFETGLKYSMQGQRYSGSIVVDGNTNDTVNQIYSSELNLNYIQVPLLLTFNSLLANVDDEKDALYMTIAMGIQLDWLSDASLTISPDVDWSKYPNAKSEFNNLFNSFNISFAGNVSLNWQLNHGWQINATLFGSKSLDDVENKDFKFDKTQFPLEYQFPVGIKKEAVTTEVRYKAKNVVYGLMVGISYRLIHK
jgi:hypothetical protein